MTFAATRSGGPGGQSVNTTDSAVIVTWRYKESGSFTPEEKALIAEKLKNRINKDGELSLKASNQRSQRQNREAAIERLTQIVREAVAVDAIRETEMPEDVRRKADAARLRDKKHAQRLKQQTRGGRYDD